MNFYTVKEAAVKLRVCAESVRRMVRQGAQHRRLGKKIILTDADLLAMTQRAGRDTNPYLPKGNESSEPVSAGTVE